MGIAGTGKTTIAQAIAKQDNRFKIACHHTWLDPILNLLSDTSASIDPSSVWLSLDQKGWETLSKASDLILHTIADVCPKESNFVITYEMLANNPYHQVFFDKVHAVAKKRNATLFPIRLVCELNELLDRVQHQNRMPYFKTRDVNLIKKRFAEEQVFFSNLATEYTLNVSHLTPEEAAVNILRWVQDESR